MKEAGGFHAVLLFGRFLGSYESIESNFSKLVHWVNNARQNSNENLAREKHARVQ